MSTATITWQISGKELVSFLHAKNNKIYKSNGFYISSSHGSAKFELECYSNGMNAGEEGSVDLFLKIVSLPEHASDITLRYILECVETSTSFSKIKRFNRETTNSCWPYNTLHLAELMSLQIVTFICNIGILSISYKKTKSVIGRITSYFCSSAQLKMHKYTSFTWNILDIEYDNFMNCSNRKQIHSSSFGFGDHYQLECYPNGTKLDQRGNVIMGLSLLSLPPLISSIKLFYSFKCIECNKEWSNVHNFNYKSSVKGWPIGLIKQDLLYKLTKNTKQITFKCCIEILKLYDEQNQQIKPKHFHRFIIDNTTQKHHTKHHSDNSFEENIKDIEIATLNANIMTLQQTVDVLKREIYSLRDYHRKPLLKTHQSMHHIYNNHHKRTKHPRSISEVDPNHRHNYVPTKKHFYPYNNSLSVGADHNSNNNNKNIQKKHQKRKTYHGGVYDYNYNVTMKPLDDHDDDNNYKNWYHDPIKHENELKKKQRKKTDEGFAANIRSFAAVNNIVKSDAVKAMQTNEEEESPSDNDDDDDNEHKKKKKIRFENNNSNPFFKEINNEYNGRYYKDEGSLNRKKKYHHHRRHKSNHDKEYQRSKSEKKMHWRKQAKQERVPSFEEEDLEERDIYKLKKWLCNDMGFSTKYFNLFMQNGYDNIDIIVELKEKDLIQIGIHNKKYRRRLLKEFAKYNPFQTHTLSGPPPLNGSLI